MLLEAKKLDKSFNCVYALKGLDLSLKEGEIHGLVGENGAGKSTFIKILGGVYTKNGGELSWNGAPFPADFGPVESRELGINIIFQDHVLIPAFSALENIWLGRPYPRKGGLIQWKEMEKAAQKKGEELGIHLDLKKSIFQMTPAQKKCVEILRAMMSDCKLMILDEPTASLSDKEANLLFSIIKNLKANGTAVLYVTHRLEEIMALTDRVTVLRNGKLVSTCDTGSTSQKELDLLVEVQVAVRVHRCLHLFMSEPLRDQQRREAHLHQQAGVAVANVMHPDALYPRCLAAILHFVIQKALGVGKEPVVLLQPVAIGHILL